MRVCFITPYSLRIVSGVSRVVTDLCKGLKKRNIDHLIITSRLKDEIEKDKDIEAIEINVSKINNFKGTYLAIKTIINIIKHRKDIDILHLQSPHLQPMFSAILGKVLGKPVIATIHAKFLRPKNIHKRLYLWITIKGTITFADKITFVDEEARQHYKVTSGEVIENGIDTKVFSPNLKLRKEIRSKMGLSENEIVLLYLGRLAANKGVYDLLEVISAARNKTNWRLKLILVGSGEIKNISERIKSLRLEEDVQLFGGKREVIPYYCASDIFVLYSAIEGLPMVLLEASSCGLVIVSTKVGGIPSIIKDGKNGLLLDYGDKNGLIQKIEMVAKDEKLREYLGKNARKRVVECYSIGITLDRYVDLYKRVLKNKRL